MTSDREIANLIARYAELTDAGDFESLGALFENADFSLNGGERLRGSAAVTQLGLDTLRTYDDGIPMTRHVTTNVMIDVDDDHGTAIGRAYFTVFQAVADPRSSPSPAAATGIASSAAPGRGALPHAR